MKFLAPVGAGEILPDARHGGLVAGIHLGYYDWPADKLPYERNPESAAYVPYGVGRRYVQGAINGGTAAAYLAMCRELAQSTRKDLDNGIVAKVHDESHLNRYFAGRPEAMLLEPLYGYIEGSKRKPDIYRGRAKIIARDKRAPEYGGHEYLRGTTDRKIRRNPALKALCRLASLFAPTRAMRRRLRARYG
jgi:hypothetical protein